MDFRMERIKQMLLLLEKAKFLDKLPLTGWRFATCGYKQDNSVPDSCAEGFRDFGAFENWGREQDGHGWFCRHIRVPETWADGEIRFSLRTGAEGEYDPLCAQMIAYIDGQLVQGMDGNHTELYLEDRKEFDLALYAYSGMNSEVYTFRAELQLVQTDCEGLYYDLRVPLEILEFSDPSSKTYADVLHILNEAVNCMDCLL